MVGSDEQLVDHCGRVFGGTHNDIGTAHGEHTPGVDVLQSFAVFARSGVFTVLPYQLDQLLVYLCVILGLGDLPLVVHSEAAGGYLRVLVLDATHIQWVCYFKGFRHIISGDSLAEVLLTLSEAKGDTHVGSSQNLWRSHY